MAVVIVAPDSFKGTASAVQVARAIGEGWRRMRPQDEVVEMPMADGGEGTLDAFEAAVPAAVRRSVPVSGPAPGARGVGASWIELPPLGTSGHRTGVVEIADAAGFTRLAHPAPLDAHTRGLGEVIRAVLDHGVDELIVGLGGSCSTDGGAGALRELGAVLVDEAGHPSIDGGRGLLDLAAFDGTRLRHLPPRGVRLLTDVDNPLLGPRGAAAVFGPQKGASVADVALLEDALSNWARLCGGDPTVAGTGAAGGTAFGLLRWGATISSGSRAVAELVGLAAAVRRADVVVTGEGSFDEQTASGKAPGIVLDTARLAGVPSIVVAGSISIGVNTAGTVSLCDIAGSRDAAMSDAIRWLTNAGALAASQCGQGSRPTSP